MPICLTTDTLPKTSPAALDAAGEAVFASVLRAHQLQARISTSASYCDNWTDPEPASNHGTFHLIDEGVCWVRSAVMPDATRLAGGDLVVFPGGAAHVLAASARADAGPDARFTSMLCGEFEFASGKRNAIVDALPDWFIVREDESGRQFRQLAQLMLHEARTGAFGSRAVLDKMADTLFVMAVRHHIEHAPERRGLLAALSDPRLSRALEAMHLKPEKPWTVGQLAEISNMSRTAFATHFAAVMGQGPIDYLTCWRMTEARRLLCERSLSVAAVGDRLGYTTEAAFRRAFKRITGTDAGAVRRGADAI